MTATLSDAATPSSGTPDDEPAERAAEAATGARPVPAALLAWRDPHPWVGWLLTAVLAALAAITRFWGLGYPPTKIFDEAYYPVEAQELLRFGYEDNRGYMFVVHPPLGKWLIGWGTAIFGSGPNDAFGWRAMPAVFGVLTVVVMTRVARRMTRSNVFGAIAGALILMDGLSLVLARTAILDVFLEFFILATFACLVVDRDQMRARLARLVAEGADLSAGMPWLGPRPWRLLAGVMIGLAGAVKWTALSFYVLFGLMSWLWDRGAFRSAGVRRPTAAALRRSVPTGIVSLYLVPLAVYTFCWLGWFTGENSWGRHWADTHTAAATWKLGPLHLPLGWLWSLVPAALRSLASYTLDAYRFHEGLTSGHSYASGPWSWLILGRPVDFSYDGNSHACGATYCSREVLLIGTPLMWWAFVPMLLWLAWHYITTRDWRAGAIWVAFAAGWLVWFQDLARTMFLFYIAPLLPFLIIGLTVALGVMVGPAVRRTGDAARDDRAARRRRWGTAGVATYLGLVIADFAWMWPIFTGALISYDVWHAHMWLPSWV